MRTLNDMSWTRRGFSLLWDANALSRIARPSQVVSMRQFFTMQENWPQDLPASDGDALVVAGLEGCLDILSHDDAITWMESDLKACILSFQDEYEGDTALIFWLPAGRKRIQMQMAAETYTWKCAAPKGDRTIQIGQSLWAGAEREVSRILLSEQPEPDPDGPAWIGLFHPRIS